ncbi:MAG: MFS transporter [Polyangiaceae bacterium]|nr:MFS transporter [Polyangiaceae bacterium]
MRKLAIASWGLSVGLAPLNSTMIAVAVPPMARGLGRPIELVTVVAVASYLVASVVFSAPAGRLGDAIGHRTVQRLGLVAFAAAAVLGAVLHTIVAVGVARVAMAAGASMVVPAALATVRAEVAPADRPRFLGAFSALMGVSAAIGPLLGGELVQRFGWQSVFWVNVPVVLLALALSVFVSPREAPRDEVSFDVPGALLFAMATVPLVAARSSRAPAGWLGLGVVAFAAFTAWELRAPAPAVDVRLLGIPAFRSSSLVIALQNLAMYGLLTVLPLMVPSDTPPRVVGRMMLLMTGGMVAGSLAVGALSRRLGARGSMTLGASLSALGMAALIVTPLDAPALGPACLVALGLGVTSPGAQAVSLSAVDAARGGRAAGVVSAARYLGGIIGVVVASACVSAGLTTTMLALFSGVLAVTVGLSLTLPAPQR